MSLADPGNNNPAPQDPDPAVVAALRAAGCVYAEAEAALLTESADSSAHLRSLLARRSAGEPLEQVLGWAEFRGLRVDVEPGVFVPRRRSGLLVELAVAADPTLVVDLCCGTGAVGVAIVAESATEVELHVADLDPVAVHCAARNVARVGGQAHAGDLFEALPTGLRGRVDVLAVNAPYVPTGEIALMPTEARDHEHRLALDGGVDGLDVQRRIAAVGAEWLSPGGLLVLETSRAQAPESVELLGQAGLSSYAVRSEELDGTAAVGRRES